MGKRMGNGEAEALDSGVGRGLIQRMMAEKKLALVRYVI